MGATYSLPNTISNGTTGDADEVQGNFTAIINNHTPTGMDDHSSTDGQAQTQIDPFPASTLSKATSLAEEIEQLRYVLKEILGETYWYIDPDVSLASIFTNYVTLTGTETLSAKTLTALKIVSGDGIADAGGAFYLKFTEDATPVNYLDVGNADTGVSPNITAAGSDTNIDITLIPKGSGVVDATGGLKIDSGAEIAKYLSATTAWDPASIAAGGKLSTTITVTGAALGDPCTVGLTSLVAANGDTEIAAHVEAADTVRVILKNHTGSAQNLANGTLRVGVFQH
ncbi:MAG: hypothetical protein V3R78_10190 [Thermodesulfobacteriota bacterium]